MEAKWRSAQPVLKAQRHRTEPSSAAIPSSSITAKHHSSSSQNIAVNTNADDPVEAEYIYNLQQQVYFLELEARYLRERRDKCHTCEDKGEEDQESHLRSKVEELQRACKQEAKQYEEKVRQIAEEKQILITKVQQLREEHEELVKHPERQYFSIIKEKEEVTSASIAAEMKMKELQSKMHRTEVESERINKDRDELLHQRETLLSNIEAFEDELEEIHIEIEAVEENTDVILENIDRIKVRLNDLQIDLNMNSGSLSAAEEQQLQQQINILDMQVKQTLLRQKQMETSQLTAQHTLSELVSHSIQFEEKIADLERKISKEISRAVPPQMIGENKTLSQRVAYLEREIAEMENLCVEAEKEEKQMRKSTHQKRKELVDLNSQRDKLNRRLALQQFRTAVLSEENERLDREIRRLIRDEKEDTAMMIKRENETTERMLQCAKLEVIVQQLEEKLGDQAYSKVDVSMFDALLNANMKVAQNFQALMNSFHNGSNENSENKNSDNNK